MTPAEAADLKGAMDRTVVALTDKFHPEAQVRARLDFLLWRVMEGRCSDFFEVEGQDGNGNSIYNERPVRSIEHRFKNPITDQDDSYAREVYSTSPQWANHRRLKDANGQEFVYIHCRYKGSK